MANVHLVNWAAIMGKPWATTHVPRREAQVGWMAFEVRSRRYDPHVYMCRACGTWNLVLFPHGRADWDHDVQVPPGISMIPTAMWATRPINSDHQIITRRVRRTDGGRLAAYIHVGGVRQAVPTPLPTTVTSATMWAIDRRTWNEERGDVCMMVCGNVVASVVRDQLEWCLRTTFCRGWPVADMAPIDHEIVEAAYRLDGEPAAQVAVVAMLEEAKRVPRYWDRRILLPMWDKLHTDDEQ